MYHNTSSVVSLVGSRVKPVRNRFSVAEVGGSIGNFGRRNLFSTLDLNLDFQGCGQIGILERKVEVGIESE